MTMDHIYKSHQQHEFLQQPLQQQQHQHQPPLLQPNLTQSMQTQHLYQQHNHQNQLLLQHQHHNSQTNPNALPILHRPMHPPPPPPTISSQQRLINSAPDHDAINHVVQPPNIASNTPSSTNNPSNYNPSIRSSFHSNYYANTQYQIYQPTNLQTNYHHHPRQSYEHHHMHLPNSALQHQVTNSVGDSSSSLDNYNNSHDHYTEDVIIQAILAAKEALEKPIEERDERDILLIDNLCSLVHGFDAFPKTVRRALAAQAVLIVIDEKGKELIVHNEELDSFCVLIFGECEQLNIAKTIPIRYYNVGDAFGVCEPTNETIRFVGHMTTRCENCAFLCVKRDDFYTILTDPANYPNKDIIRHKDRNGNIVCVSQFDIDKKSSGPLWSHHMQSTNPFKMVLPDGHIIIKATEACLLMALVDGINAEFA